MEDLDCDVAVVGAGPAGAVLANLLGHAGVSVALLEARKTVIGHPRAVGIDDEAVRTLQSVGLAQVVLDNSLQNAPIRYHDSRGHVLAHVAPSARPYGWPRRNLFYQPFLEERLHEHLAGYPDVVFRTGAEVTALSQDSGGVRLRARADDGEFDVRARYAVGADGGRSFVRGALGVELLGDTAPVKWLVVDVEKDTWHAPYSAVYTSAFRPCMTIPLPFGYRRFEFQIREEEDPAAISDPASVQRLLKRFYPDSPVPPVVRGDVYWHHSRTAATFGVGRVFLAGDAAHLQPPFFGQGMNSGFRDVTNLAWKLTSVVGGRAKPGILASYDSERRHNAAEMVRFATRMGRMYKARSVLTERVRSRFFVGVQRIPGARDYILQMKYKPVPRYTDGLVVGARDVDKGSLVGRAFPQPPVRTAAGESARLDDVLGPRVAVVGLVSDAASGISAGTAERLRTHGGVVVQVRPARVYRRESASATDLPAEQVEVFDVDGGLRDLLLARPADEVYVVRPDRYVAAACRAADLDRVLGAFLALLES
ncbi:bifunctional 3-(3-hydroxy-phenyl)propionate/3-hydroxycinnamic acid hydroxylase [Amycolatopsis acidiphila]|uniref:Bifunctional 3-(3-hydroxy-phenyl)propionate/3-hydroxycinnamic acid hydroxylase n=1 Tax=Amycolatopsis acidiphila TaxID=715473 RepID=A0A558AP89_9PSEU|nr:bifunctional 3-(3-hydroxy-phenyl)propionate/3-hydroxycinnamic acid hydroxylase [Amycolatopsis acidiphila]TVT26062.1 bifunctional 3-(3-hydroxy-phenyl)propionate/3-hydroxycinnamic acid hydroxylase [Amycolatopsis acidiphila]UIJ63216.1 bifunctional 3-(3-hydroxy-phenyl)propionate/3-hydroxycinnamic acid hydroxylase [Amycolatopsis acidiphila]GHG74400.1 3-(3-hydroxy-phenyl)propionate/3-hydroxycinnamic acid hydroxylase [Amycolatopsis acidiphila]